MRFAGFLHFRTCVCITVRGTLTVYNRTMRFVVPEDVVTQFHIRDGDAVADFGAGSGFFAKVLSRAVGSGKVYALEIQRQLVEKVADLARTEHLSNVEVMWCDLEAAGGVKLSDGALDVGIMVNALFQFEDRDTAIAEAARLVRPGGKFFVIDWTESFGGLGPHPDQIIGEDAARELAERHGFTFERSFPAGGHHYGLAFRRT